MEDALIIELYWQRNEDAIKETDNKYGAYCFSVANNVLRDNGEAEECVNDTYLRAWNAMPPKRPSLLRAFLAKITRRLAFNRYDANAAKKRGGGETAAVLEELAECIAS
ncbi:MAG: RNA polymerase subunit sigma-70, partial [Oscillospiraceae bacterium]|nr:RNA polymerase subunit sigma-70 [Oscillospiraceae bacterium]